MIAAGFHLGIGGTLTYKRSELPAVLPELDPAWLVLETDSPYLAPVPYRGKRNESAYLVHVAEKLAEVLQMDRQTVVEQTSRNARALFDLPA